MSGFKSYDRPTELFIIISMNVSVFTHACEISFVLVYSNAYVCYHALTQGQFHTYFTPSGKSWILAPNTCLLASGTQNLVLFTRKKKKKKKKKQRTYTQVRILYQNTHNSHLDYYGAARGWGSWGGKGCDWGGGSMYQIEYIKYLNC